MATAHARAIRDFSLTDRAPSFIISDLRLTNAELTPVPRASANLNGLGFSAVITSPISTIRIDHIINVSLLLVKCAFWHKSRPIGIWIE